VRIQLVFRHAELVSASFERIKILMFKKPESILNQACLSTERFTVHVSGL